MYSENKNFDSYKEMNRRDFLVIATVLPLIITTRAESNPLFGLLVRLFARNVARSAVRSVTNNISRNVVRSKLKTSSGKKEKNSSYNSVSIDNIIKSRDSIENMIDITELLADQVWEQNTVNESSMVITNSSSKALNTGDIILELYDKKNNIIDFTVKIEPIEIPPSSNIILEISFKNLRNDGLKTLHGRYGNNINIKSSGNILVVSSGRGKTVDELYQRYYETENNSILII